MFDRSTRDELMTRIDLLNSNCKPKWGKMNVYQMAKHCTIWDEWVLGKNNPEYKQELLGRIFGKMALKNFVKDDRPLKKNMPAGNLVVRDNDGTIDFQKKLWMERVAEYETYSNPRFIHDFFGKMTIDEIGIFAYKHSDHHLRQFNVD